MAIININNEYSRLTDIIMYRPLISEISTRELKENMYVNQPVPEKVLEEFDSLVNMLRNLDINVFVLEKDYNMPITTNMIFLRDVAVIYKDKIVLCNMKYDIRKPEPAKFMDLIKARHPELAESIVGQLSHNSEGADFLVQDDNLYIYTGNRTEAGVANELTKLFPETNLINIDAKIKTIPQHLLGGMHIVNQHMATVRCELINTKIANFEYIQFEENTETMDNFSLNILTISPNEVVMPNNCPNTKAQLEECGILCHEIEVGEIHKMGGGIACMVLPIARGDI